MFSLPVFLVVTAFVSAAIAQSVSHLRASRLAAAAPTKSSAILVHSINDERCTGCETCVKACPTNVLSLVAHKSRAVAFEQCVQCELCARVCPTRALVMHREDEAPPTISVPDVDANFQTAVPGQYLIGEVAGKPLVKNAANLGRFVVEHMVASGLTPGPKFSAQDVDVAIVGSGPGGLSAALACLHHGLSCVVLEKDQMLASTVARYPGGKQFMAEPVQCRNLSFLPVFDARKEALLRTWEQLVERSRLPLRLGEAVEGIEREGGGAFCVTTTVAAYRARRVVLATGVRGKPRTLGVVGENLPKVMSMLEDAAAYRERDVVVVGGGDSALEAACSLAESGARVTMSYRRSSFGRAKPANVERVDEHVAAGRVVVRYSSTVNGITERELKLTLDGGGVDTIPNDACFVLIGADRPVKWLSRVGVAFVERPHTFELGQSDVLVQSVAGHEDECPRSADAALARIRGQRAPAVAVRTRGSSSASSVVKSASRPKRRATTLGRRRATTLGRRATTLGSICRHIRRVATSPFHRLADEDLEEVTAETPESVVDDGRAFDSRATDVEWAAAREPSGDSIRQRLWTGATGRFERLFDEESDQMIAEVSPRVSRRRQEFDDGPTLVARPVFLELAETRVVRYPRR